MTEPKEPREFDLKQANEIIEEYSKPHSMIDNGNLFFACCEYQEAYQSLQSELEKVKAEIQIWMKKVSEKELLIVDWENYVAREKDENFKLKSELAAEKAKSKKLIDALEEYKGGK